MGGCRGKKTILKNRPEENLRKLHADVADLMAGKKLGMKYPLLSDTRYPQLPSGEVSEAWESMPRTADGFIVALQYTPAKHLAAYEAEWRKWATAHPRELWPDWLIRWAESKP